MKTGLLVGLVAMLCLCGGVSREAAANEFTHELGPFGEITSWLILPMPATPFDQDPLTSVGGEAAYAAMANPKLVPERGRALEFPDGAGKTNRIGEGAWEAIRMVAPDMPGLHNEYLRLVVPDGYSYAHCRLDSPSDRKAGLLAGLRKNDATCRLYLNGADLGTIKGGFGFEAGSELPIKLKQGGNHLLVRFETGTLFHCRLIGEHAEPLRDVKATISGLPPLEWSNEKPAAVEEPQRLVNLAKAIPAPAPAEHPELLGANLGRTMALLESGYYMHRPVRIIFSGQSIETHWTRLLIERLRERYPGTEIIAENRAIGGWFVWRMQKLLKHDILRWKPDLVVFSAYQGTAEVWERFLAELRSETTADIIIRTSHIKGRDPRDTRENSETILLRRLAANYDVELIEVRNEWLDYLTANDMTAMDLVRDGTHLNPKGETLMALLYERHFTPVAAGRKGWTDRVRRFDVGRFLVDNRTDEIVLEGGGWRLNRSRFAMSNSAEDRLRLKFRGTRVDLVLPAGHGRAAVRIDGRTPSEWNLFSGTRPMRRNGAVLASNYPMTYHIGPGMRDETWVLTVLEGNVDKDPKKANDRVRFTLSGSKTGLDGEGWNDRKFVSNSGRITLLSTDWETTVQPVGAEETQPVMQTFSRPPQLVWHIRPTGFDVVPFGTAALKTTDHYSGQAYEYVTVADGLPCGLHELTLTPIPDDNPQNAFVISGVETHRPPLARDVEEWSTAP